MTEVEAATAAIAWAVSAAITAVVFSILRSRRDRVERELYDACEQYTRRAEIDRLRQRQHNRNKTPEATPEPDPRYTIQPGEET